MHCGKCLSNHDFMPHMSKRGVTLWWGVPLSTRGSMAPRGHDAHTPNRIPQGLHKWHNSVPSGQRLVRHILKNQDMTNQTIVTNQI